MKTPPIKARMPNSSHMACRLPSRLNETSLDRELTAIRKAVRGIYLSLVQTRCRSRALARHGVHIQVCLVCAGPPNMRTQLPDSRKLGAARIVLFGHCNQSARQQHSKPGEWKPVQSSSVPASPDAPERDPKITDLVATSRARDAADKRLLISRRGSLPAAAALLPGMADRVMAANSAPSWLSPAIRLASKASSLISLRVDRPTRIGRRDWQSLP